MLSEAAYADVYLDLQDFSRLRSAAREQSPEALDSVAKQFESVFVKMMLQSMRDASFGDPLFDTPATGFYRDIFDHQLALELSHGRGLGLADLMVEQLRGHVTDQGAVPEPGLAPPIQRPGRTGGQPPTLLTQAPSFESKEEFVRSLLPYAQNAAQRLGVSADLLLAQAALETGWGRAVIRRPDGSSSHNLFGIKANGRWSGERVTVNTLEYVDGLPTRQQADFRTYASFSESFDDYADLLQSAERYSEALTRTADPEAFMQSLQEAGYATDPAYARKVIGIWREELGGAMKIALSKPI